MGACSCYLFIEMKCILVRLPAYVIGSILAGIVNVENERISN